MSIIRKKERLSRRVLSSKRPIEQTLRAVTVVTVLTPAVAHAYIDPSTGSYVLQVLVAGLLGALFALKMFWHRVVAFFQDLTSRSKPTGSSSGESSEP